MSAKRMVVPPGYKLVFRPYFVHKKSGKRVYPRNGRVFPLLVKIDQ